MSDERRDFAAGGIVKGAFRPVDRDPEEVIIPASEIHAYNRAVLDRLADTESMSAALRRVEQERDEAVANFKRLQVLARGDFEKCTAVIKQTGDDRDLARAELASARTELDAVRAARDTLDRELSEVRAEADEKVRAVLAADYRPAAVVHAYDALYCRTCYARFLPDTPAAETHPHPLVPVRVSITSRTEEQ